MDNHKYVYIVVRTDIPVAHQMAQACHGALESGKVFNEVNDEPDSIVVLKVKSQEELIEAQLNLNMNGIKTVAFWEPDWDYGWTSFGTEPLTQDQRHHLKDFKLWRP